MCLSNRVSGQLKEIQMAAFPTVGMARIQLRFYEHEDFSQRSKNPEGYPDLHISAIKTNGISQAGGWFSRATDIDAEGAWPRHAHAN